MRINTITMGYAYFLSYRVEFAIADDTAEGLSSTLMV